MKGVIVISEDKQACLDRLLAGGVKLTEISRLIGVQYDTLREKLKRRKRGDKNWHNREQVDSRGHWERAKRPSDDERDDVRIALFDLTKNVDGITVVQAMRMTGYSEAVCRRELDDFCHRPTRSDVEAICRKDGDRYHAVGWQTKGNHAGKSIDIVKVIGGRCTGHRKMKASNSNW